MVINQQIILNIIARLTSSQTFCIAYSGGIDSHVLLHIMARLQQQNRHWHCRAVHINHRWSADTDAWQRHCQQVCASLSIDYQAYSIDNAFAAGDSVEQVMRQRRYQQLAEVLQAGECLLTAHNQDDQAETLLLQLLRGAGVKGLAAMPAIKSFAAGQLVRVLLDFSRADIECYAQQHQLQWIDDDSNQDTRFQRNFVRQHVMPLLRQRWPQCVKTIARSANHCAQAQTLLDHVASSDYAEVYQANMRALMIDSLQQLSPARQRNVLRHWIDSRGFLLPTSDQLEQLRHDVLYAQTDATPHFRWQHGEIRRYQNYLYVMAALPAHDSQQVIAWDLSCPLTLPNQLGRLVVKPAQSLGIRSDLPSSQFSVRFRQGGEKLRPIGSKHSRELKTLFQAWRVPPWQRQRMPLIYYDNQLVAVVGFAIDRCFAAMASEGAITIEWQ